MKRASPVTQWDSVQSAASQPETRRSATRCHTRSPALTATTWTPLLSPYAVAALSPLARGTAGCSVAVDAVCVWRAADDEPKGAETDGVALTAARAQAATAVAPMR